MNMPSLLRRAILLACAAMMSTTHPPRCRCDAFSYARPRDVVISSSSRSPPPPPRRRRHHLSVSAADRTGVVVVDADDRSRPNIVRIVTHDDYVDFLRSDDRVCVIKYYADWCKSCQKFGAKFRHLAHDLGDRIDVDGDVVRSGRARFAEVEYATGARLCRALKVNRLPTVHVYRPGRGKVVDVTCKPSLFHLVVDELHRVMDETDADANEARVGTDGDMAHSSFDATMVAGSYLGEEIVASLQRGKEKDEGAKEVYWGNERL
ncbi:hypothetical protein ACHAXA_001176 [Cyclostephanos tholiformis]|uniref:Thioredoxin domain-containing protein n=1 Tax=Cyclostephanos tholiformis TaxID=382380 RepID=A0ABD3R5M5_9STRA